MGILGSTLTIPAFFGGSSLPSRHTCTEHLIIDTDTTIALGDGVVKTETHFRLNSLIDRWVELHTASCQWEHWWLLGLRIIISVFGTHGFSRPTKRSTRVGVGANIPVLSVQMGYQADRQCFPLCERLGLGVAIGVVVLIGIGVVDTNLFWLALAILSGKHCTLDMMTTSWSGCSFRCISWEIFQPSRSKHFAIKSSAILDIRN